MPGKGGGSRPNRPWRTVAASVVTVGVLVAVFAGVFPRFAEYSQAWSAIQRIPAAFVIALVVAAVVNIAVSAWPVQAALPGLGYRPALLVGQTSYAMSNALPGGGAVALGVKYDMLGSYGFGTAAAAGATAISAVFNIFATLAMPVLSVVALLLNGQLHWQYVLIAIVGGVAVGVSAAAMAAVLRSEEGARRVGHRLDRFLNPLVRRLRHGRGIDVAGKVLDFRSHVIEVMRVRWPAVVGSALLPLFTSWSILLIGLRGLEHAGAGHTGVTWAESLAALSAAMVMLFLPISVGGLGTVDATLTGLLSAFGATASQALAVDVVWRAATFLPQVLTGALAFLWWRATGRRRQRRRAAPST
jgi:uncharacterized membrane protein YbhN (UPF0104 family)